MSAPPKEETFEELVARLAYHIVQGVAKGTGAEQMASVCAQQTLLWRKEKDKQEKSRGH